jgi:hypothetical protein
VEDGGQPRSHCDEPAIPVHGGLHERYVAATQRLLKEQGAQPYTLCLIRSAFEPLGRARCWSRRFDIVVECTWPQAITCGHPPRGRGGGDDHFATGVQVMLAATQPVDETIQGACINESAVVADALLFASFFPRGSVLKATHCNSAQHPPSLGTWTSFCQDKEGPACSNLEHQSRHSH